MLRANGGGDVRDEKKRERDSPSRAQASERAELPGSKLGTFASMVPMKKARLEQSLEDITGPIDPQQVHKAPTPRTTLSPASDHLGLC